MNTQTVNTTVQQSSPKVWRWHFKNGEKWEDYTVLYQDVAFCLVQNQNTLRYSFGLTYDFGSFLGFPVNQSCLDDIEIVDRLNDFIRIDTKYIGQTAGLSERNIARWLNMLAALPVRAAM